MSDESDNEYQFKGKKRRKNESQHKKNVIKSAKVKGLAHTSHIGKQIPARVTGSDCGCKQLCMKKLSEEDRKDILRHFHDMDSKVEQDIYLQSLITAMEKKRHRPRKENPKSRESIYKYHVMVGSSKIVICKAAFVSLHSVGKKRIERLATLQRDHKIPKEQRGGARHCMPAHHIEKINLHIESFPLKTARYSNKEVQYLDSRLNVKSMYNMFCQQYPDTPVKYEYYLGQFNYNHCLRFGRPQVDICGLCEELSIKIKSPTLNEAAKRAATAEKIVHSRRSKKFYNKINEIQEKCKEDSTVAALSFDYMQNLPLPNIPVQEIFYYRQLWVFSFCIHNLKNDSAKFYVYHEGVAKKGPDEVCSFLLDYINEHISTDVKELHLFSDACGGQNRNHTLLRFCLFLATSGRFEKIYHYFPVRGHSFLACDRNFGVVKRVIRKIDRVYIPNEYVEIIKTARKKTPFQVKLVNRQDILNFKQWWPQYFKKTCASLETMRSNARIEKFAISKYRMLEFSSRLRGKVITREFIDGLCFSTFNLLKPAASPVLPSQQAYDLQIPINGKKMADIKKVVKYVDADHLPFYDDLVSWRVTDVESDTEDGQ